MTKILIAAMVLTLTPFGVARAQQKTIEQRLAEALENAKKGDQKSVALLKKDCELVKAIPFLRRYLDDPNDRVKSSVFALAEGVHTPEAVSILTDLMKEGHGRWGEAPVKAFYYAYDCKELLDGGGPRLRDNLILFVENERNFSRAKGILLLSCFKDDKDVIRALESLDKGQRKMVALDLNNYVDLATSVELALAEIGHKSALERFLQRLGKGEVNDLIFAFRAIRFINKKEVLAALVEKISDKRKAVYPWSDNFYLRISDLAVNALVKKARQPLEIVVRNNYRYSDRELERAYELLKLNLPLKLINSFGPGMVVPSNYSADHPPVVSAVAPIYPAIALSMNAKGDVFIEVLVDAAGKVVSATVVSGNEYLRETSKQAAMKWQFGTVKEGSKPRTARLTFVYRYGDVTQPLRTQPEITTVFRPPYRVELISQPYIIN